MQLIDISPEMERNMVVYPKDPEFILTSVLDISKGHEMNVSKVSMGVHTGSHIDSPLHFVENGASITDLPLTRFYGRCRVLDLTHIEFGHKITKEDIKRDSFHSESIILLKTQNSKILTKPFCEDHVALSLEAAKFIIDSQVEALGIDYLSIGDQNIHRLLLANGIIIYEGLALANVDPGKYTFCGFPLKILGSEGAPTRAVLFKE